MSTKTKQTTTAKGLGWRHQQAREGLLRKHTDGAKCDWCGRSMYRDRTRNHDYNAASTNPDCGKLQADHATMTRAEALRRGVPVPLPNRLLHGECNRQRGDGANDHLAAVSSGRSPIADTSTLVMPWPW